MPLKYPERATSWQRWRSNTPIKYALDVDNLEIRQVDGRPQVVAMLEITEDAHGKLLDAFLSKIQERYHNGVGQGSWLLAVSSTLGVPMFVVVHSKDFSRFAVLDVRRPVLGWAKLSEKGMLKFLRSLERLWKEHQQRLLTKNQ